MKTGLYFGSFNPIHKGHIDIANYLADNTDLEIIWLILSPHNPLKAKDTLLDSAQRLEMLRKAVQENYTSGHRSIELKHVDVEFNLPQPSYTINTLKYISDKYPNDEFILIIGSDNLSIFHKWKEYKRILETYKLYVYPRPGSDGGILKQHQSVKMLNSPLITISSDLIRKHIKEGKNVSKMLSAPVHRYIKDTRLYMNL